MSREPSFDELVGGEPAGAERERLRRAHELLLQAGPPPELPPALASAPDVGLRRRRRGRTLRRGAALLLAAALAVAVAFAAGYVVADQRGGGGAKPSAILALQGTAAAPRAHATLELFPARAGNWPMTLSVVGLPQRASYEVYLVRRGQPWKPCGTFVAAGGKPVTVTLNAPYRLRPRDSWVVTRQASGREPGVTVLRPATTA
ncbi:MAG TPA: hypothetical protein VE995_09020 [Gaiellaceae bacterium]|nr:hypothetical protein [Gaiellaceae bacterium]